MERIPTAVLHLDSIEEGLSLQIDAKTPGTLFDATTSASQHMEAPIQLVEGFFYDYTFSNPSYFLTDPSNNIVRPHKRLTFSGTLAPNIYVGTLEIPIHKNGLNRPVGAIKLEVQSVKAGYRDDYRNMLGFITEKCTHLLLQANAPVTHSFDVDYNSDSETLYQRFAFINSVLGTDDFAQAVHRIVSMPATRWSITEEERDVRSTGRFQNAQIKQIIKGSKRTPLPKGHPLLQYGIESLPEKITTTRKTDTVDTPENRFIKHALETFLKLCTDIYHIAKARNYPKLQLESEGLVTMLENQLHHSFFKEISRPTTLNLNSPVLQRKEGYREVLHIWLMLDLAAKLVWKGGDDVYSGGKKDVAVLYEYWLFFMLLDLLQNVFHIEAKDITELIQPTDDGLNLQIKQGKFIALRGIYDTGSRKLYIRFSYNRTFSGKQAYPQAGSWTVTLRPDYTLSLWPFGISEEEAEKQELIVHLHFDAKYKVDNLTSFASHFSEQELDEEKLENRKGIYKNADLLKMHAYKDAIRRTSGAYVLYPGHETFTQKGFHEIIPGLGAFPLSPSKAGSGVGDLKTFIEKILSHFLNRISQREKMAFSTYDIYQSQPTGRLTIADTLPEPFVPNRDFIPDQVFVLVGLCKSSIHYQWIKDNQMYSIGLDSYGKPAPITKEMINARFLLLFSLEDNSQLQLWNIQQNNVTYHTRNYLEERNYPSPTYDSYLVFHLLNVSDPYLANLKADITKLHFSTEDSFRVITLAELLRQG